MPSALPKVVLHQFPQSHFCIRIRWILALKKIPFEVVNYRLSELDGLLKITGGYRKLPVLQWGNEVICDSPVIARFLESKVPQPPIFSPTASAALCDMLAGWVDGRVMLFAAKWMVRDYLEYLGNEEDRAVYRKVFKANHGIEVEEAIARRDLMEKEMLGQWTLLEEALQERAFLLGENLSYADLAVASRLRLMNIAVGYELPSQFAKSRKWYQGIRALAD